MKKSKVGFSIIGAGIVAPLHAAAINATPEAELISVVDTFEENARKLQKEYKSLHSYTSFQECLEDTDVDVVIICTPSGTHGDLTIEAARAGKHVLCEKPLEINASKMTKMIETCEENNVKLGTVYPRRTIASTVKAKQMLEKQVFGRITLADVHLKFYRSQSYYDSAGWRGTWEMDGGGALMNQGIHGIDVIQWLNGGVKKVFARTATMARNIEVEDTAVAVLEYNNGAFGLIEGSTTVYPGQKTRFEIYGDKGTVIFSDKGIEKCERLYGEDGDFEYVKANDNIPQDIPSPGHYRYVYDMTHAVLQDKDPLVTGIEARKAVDIILAIYDSSKKGKEIFL